MPQFVDPTGQIKEGLSEFNINNELANIGTDLIPVARHFNVPYDSTTGFSRSAVADAVNQAGGLPAIQSLLKAGTISYDPTAISDLARQGLDPRSPNFVPPPSSLTPGSSTPPPSPIRPGETIEQLEARRITEQPGYVPPAPPAPPAPRVAGTAVQQPPQQPAVLTQQPIPQPQVQSQVQPQIQPQAPVLPKSTYAGSSIVDYLKSAGQDSSFSARSRLAAQNGIQNYRGTAQQNTQLLNLLRGAQAPVQQPQPQSAPQPAPQPVVQPPRPSFEDTVRKLAEDYGIRPPDPNRNPATEATKLAKEIYDSLGISQIKARAESMQKEFDDLAKKETDDIAKVNDNPWISEAERSRRIIKIQDKNQNIKNELTRRISLFSGLADDARQEAQFVIGNALNATYRQEQLNQEMFFKAVDRAERTFAPPKLDPDINEFLQAVNLGLTKATTLADYRKEKEKPTGIVAEYEYYVAQEKAAGRKPLGFDAYQTRDANRRRSNVILNTYSAPYELPGVGVVQKNLRTGQIEVKKTESKGSTKKIKLKLPSGSEVEL